MVEATKERKSPKEIWAWVDEMYQGDETSLREDFVPANPLHNYPIEQKFSTPFPIKFLEIPDGFELVKLRGGQILDPEERGLIYNFVNKRTNYDWIWGWFNLYQSGVVIDKRTKHKDLRASNVLTSDTVEIEALDAQMLYRISDPRKFVEHAEDSSLNLATAVGLAQLVAYAGGKPLDKISYESDEDTLVNKLNIAPPPGSHPHEILGELGIEIKGLYLEHIDLPNEYRPILVEEARAAREAAGQALLAKGEINAMDATLKFLRDEGGIRSKKKALDLYLTLKGLDVAEHFSKNTTGKTVVLGMERLLHELADLGKNIAKRDI